MYKYVIPFHAALRRVLRRSAARTGTTRRSSRTQASTRTINGREFLLFYEQDKLRLVGWQTSKGSYWVINTLTHALTEAQMLEHRERPRGSSADSFPSAMER